MDYIISHVRPKFQAPVMINNFTNVRNKHSGVGSYPIGPVYNSSLQYHTRNIRYSVPPHNSNISFMQLYNYEQTVDTEQICQILLLEARCPAECIQPASKHLYGSF